MNVNKAVVSISLLAVVVLAITYGNQTILNETSSSSDRGPASVNQDSTSALAAMKAQEKYISALKSELAGFEKCIHEKSCPSDRLVELLSELRGIRVRNSAANFEAIARKWMSASDVRVQNAAAELSRAH